jgi:hypothetical protein
MVGCLAATGPGGLAVNVGVVERPLPINGRDYFSICF